jgi:predicted PurR-regulated permease PerM
MNKVHIKNYADGIISIINDILVPTLIAVAFLTFLWGIYKYFIKGADSDKEREAGRVFALYGVIGFVILFSVWGIVQIFIGTLGLSAGNAPPSPTINTSNTNSSRVGGSIDYQNYGDDWR